MKTLLSVWGRQSNGPSYDTVCVVDIHQLKGLPSTSGVYVLKIFICSLFIMRSFLLSDLRCTHPPSIDRVPSSFDVGSDGPVRFRSFYLGVLKSRFFFFLETPHRIEGILSL